MTKIKKCCFIGNRNAIKSEKLLVRLRKIVEDLIIKENVR